MYAAVEVDDAVRSLSLRNPPSLLDVVVMRGEAGRSDAKNPLVVDVAPGDRSAEGGVVTVSDVDVVPGRMLAPPLDPAECGEVGAAALTCSMVVR